MKADKVAKALSKFTDDININKSASENLDEYTKDTTVEERKEFYDLAGFMLMVKQNFKERA